MSNQPRVRKNVVYNQLYCTKILKIPNTNSLSANVDLGSIVLDNNTNRFCFYNGMAGPGKNKNQ